MNASNLGIDYGAGQTNIDKETGIRYGVIPQGSIDINALERVFEHGKDLGYEAAKEDLKANLRGALEDYYNGSRLDEAVEDAFDALDGWADSLEASGRWLYENRGYKLQTSEPGDLWVLRSPYFTYAQFCSPCAPGACHLDNPLDVKMQAGIPSIMNANGSETFCDSNKCYCLGPEWFEEGKVPYDMYSVETGKKL